jgi:hypothetical protein
MLHKVAHFLSWVQMRYDWWRACRRMNRVLRAARRRRDW